MKMVNATLNDAFNSPDMEACVAAGIFRITNLMSGGADQRKQLTSEFINTENQIYDNIVRGIYPIDLEYMHITMMLSSRSFVEKERINTLKTRFLAICRHNAEHGRLPYKSPPGAFGTCNVKALLAEIKALSAYAFSLSVVKKDT